MPRLSEHEGSGAIGMLKLGCGFLTSPDIIIAIRQLYSAQRSLTGYWDIIKIDAGLVSQEWRPTLRNDLRRLCIDDILSGWLLSVPDE